MEEAIMDSGSDEEYSIFTSSSMEIGMLNMKINDILNPIQIVCGLLVVFIILSATYLNRRAMDRISIRFTLAISIVDVLKAMTLILYNYNINETGSLCVFVPLLFHWLTLVYFALNAVIALNLQLVFIHGLTVNTKFELWYWIISLALPTILVSIPLGMGKFGLDTQISFCEFVDPMSPSTVTVVWSTFLVWCIGSLVYCTSVVIVVICTLFRSITVLDKVVFEKISQAQKLKITRTNEESKLKIKKLIFRVSLYCIIPLFTHTGYLVSRVLACYTTFFPDLLALFSVIGTDLPGVLNLLALLFDPALASVLSGIIYNYRLKKTPPILLRNHKSDMELDPVPPHRQGDEGEPASPTVNPEQNTPDSGREDTASIGYFQSVRPIKNYQRQLERRNQLNAYRIATTTTTSSTNDQKDLTNKGDDEASGKGAGEEATGDFIYQHYPDPAEFDLSFDVTSVNDLSTDQLAKLHRAPDKSITASAFIKQL